MKHLAAREIYILTVPYVAAVSSLSGLRVGGLHYTGFLWAAVLLAGILLILQHRGPIPFPWRIWAPWFAYVWLAAAWSGTHGRHSLQDPLQMMTPLVVGIVASFTVREERQLERLFRGFVFCLFFIAAAFAFFYFGPGAVLQKEGTGYCARPAAMTVALVGAMFLARVRRRPFQAFLGWAACFAIGVLSESRMATGVLLALLVLWPDYRTVLPRLAAAGMVVAAGIALFYSPIFQQRFFTTEGERQYAGKGTLSQVLHGDFSGSGRFDVWPLVWNEARDQHLLFGAGTGSIGPFADRAFGKTFSTPLNDYLRILFEFGLLGLVLFAGAAALQLRAIVRRRRGAEARQHWELLAAHLGFLSLFLFAITENVIVYGVYFLNPLFALTGAALGLEAARLRAAAAAVSGRDRARAAGARPAGGVEAWAAR